ncbi:hypothetical protein I4U23_022976 [Adineta vaga]|nr:hypothetical protein I4U23_022976 [Adineta vaga]
MAEKNCLTFFEQLATEIILEIFDYLSCNDIFYAFFYLNQRYNCILLNHYKYLNKFETPTNDFDFWQTILPFIASQIEYLTITNIDSFFSLNAFSNLKSLIISSSLPIYSNELVSIMETKQFQKLTTLKIQCEILNRGDSTAVRGIFRAVFHQQNCLKIFELLPQLYAYSLVNTCNYVNIQSLILTIANMEDLMIIFDYTPNLKYLNICLHSLYFRDQTKRSNNLTKIKLKTLLLTLQNNRLHRENFLVMTNFIKQFSTSLIRLSLNLNYIETKENHFNGTMLEKQLLLSMTQLKSFHLYATFDKEPTDVDVLLSTFENQFWLDHHWSVGIHGKYLFTLPFHFNKMNNFIDFDQVRSSDPALLTFPSTWSYVISINLSECINVNSNLIAQLKIKMPNLTTIILNAELMNTTEINTTLDSITTIHCRGEYLQNIKHWLTNVVPNTKQLMLTYQAQSVASTSNRTVYLYKLDAYFRGQRTTTDYIHFSNIQHVEIKLITTDVDDIYKYVLRLVRELLEMCRNLKSFLLNFDQTVFFNQDMPFAGLEKMLQLLSMDRIAKKYQIKHIHNCFQFLKKTR